MKKNCLYCNKEFVTNNKLKKHCDSSCRYKGWATENKKAVWYKLRCVTCGFEIKTKQPNHKYCSEYCRRLDKTTVKIITLKDIQLEHDNTYLGTERECEWCGEVYLSLNAPRKYCSDVCANNAGWALKKLRYYRKGISRSSKDKSRVNRAKRNGEVDFSITLPKLYKRDKGVCYLCNTPVDYADSKYDGNGHYIAGNMHPSVDHVIPLASGGTHTWDNVRLAHRVCNSIKGATNSGTVTPH